MKREMKITKSKDEDDKYLIEFSLFGADLFAVIFMSDGKLTGSSFIQERNGDV